MQEYKFKYTISDYVTTVLENILYLISFAKEKHKYRYKIVDWQKAEDFAKDQLIVFITGTKVFMQLTPKQIYEDNSLIQGFSSIDVKTIVTLALVQKDLPKYQVIFQSFRNKLSEQIITLKQKNRPEFIRVSIDELAKDISIIDNIGSRDAYNIGVSVGERNILLEKDNLRAFSND